jgi:uncharacterized membrane protein YfcA
MFALRLVAIKILIGMLVGTLVGLSGLGGAVLLLPLLIFGLGVPPIVAVGSDAAFNALTKIGAGIFHWRRGTVHWRLVAALSLGSIPGAGLGVLLLAHLRSVYGSGVNDILRTIIGVLLITVTALLFFQGTLQKHFPFPSRSSHLPYVGVGVIGVCSGFLVGMSSVGSGSIIMVLLLAVVPVPPAVLVGTDIVHAVSLTGFVSLLHLRLGTVDPSLVFPLLAGSIPGSLLGVRLSTALPRQWLRRVLCLIIFISGARMLWF